MTAQLPVMSRNVGRFRIHAIDAGALRLDGGAMFGVVPKPLWARRIAPDDRNRIPMRMRCLLVEHDAGLVLLDTGAGNKENEKFHDIYGLDNRGQDGLTWLEDGIRSAGFGTGDVKFVVSSHLHFDHAGGNTRKLENGEIVAAFPKARYVMHPREYEFATHPNERTSGSYFANNFVPLVQAGLVDVVDENRDIVPGIRYLATPGHTPGHQSIMVDGGAEKACFLADVVPTSHHLPLPWIMGYDVEPLVTLETRRWLYKRAESERWLAIFEHDAEVAWGRIVADEKSWKIADPE
jgi:glyoxylase-like metal-dependent hydrolase (beta-lactamase superfamily II)